MQLCRVYIVARRDVRFTRPGDRERERQRDKEEGREEEKEGESSPTEIATILPKPVPIV